MLAGDSSGTVPVYVDDDLTVIFNNVIAYADDSSAPAGDRGPISLGTVSTGDSIEVVAKNSPDHCGYIQLSPLYLVCMDTGAFQTLDSKGVPFQWGSAFPCDQEPAFYDTTFTVQI